MLDDIADAFGTLQPVLLEMLPVQAHIEIPEQREDNEHRARREYLFSFALKLWLKRNQRPVNWSDLLHAPAPA